MPKRIAELDGLRGAAAIAVVIAHYFAEVPHGITALAWGWLGVGVFFALSGYLIGGIILDSRGRAGFVTAFLIRRAGRILPAYALLLAAVFFVSWLVGAAPWADRPLPALAYRTPPVRAALRPSG